MPGLQGCSAACDEAHSPTTQVKALNTGMHGRINSHMAGETYRGNWWHPSAPEKLVSGTLTIDPDGTARLELNGELGPDGPTAPLLHGEANGRDVTLIDCLTERTALYGIRGRAARFQIVTPYGGVLVGALLSHKEEPRYRIAEVQLDYLTSWARMTDTKLSNNDATGAISIEMQPLRTIEANFGNFTVELRTGRKYTSSPVPYPGGEEVDLRDYVVAWIWSEEPTDYRGFDEPIRALEDLLTLSARKPSTTRSRTLYTGDPANQEDAYAVGEDILFVPGRVPSNEPMTFAKFLFTLQDIEFDTVLDRWYHLRKKVKGGLDVLLGLDYEPGGYYENRLLSAAGALESIHRGLRPGSTAIGAEEFENIKNDIETHCTEKTWNWVRERLPNTPG